MVATASQFPVVFCFSCHDVARILLCYYRILAWLEFKLGICSPLKCDVFLTIHLKLPPFLRRFDGACQIQTRFRRKILAAPGVHLQS